jgi:hypothetical protein
VSRGVDWVRAVRDTNGKLIVWLDGLVCPPGTPAGPDPDRAEMWLAQGLAAMDGQPADCVHAGTIADSIAFCKVLTWEEGRQAILDRCDEGSCWSSAYNGASDVTSKDPEEMGDEGNHDAYAAGAALAMALEDA